MLIIGSRALKNAAPHLLNRDPLDHDFVCTIEEYDKFVKCIPKEQLKAAYPINEASKMIVKTFKDNQLNIFEFEIAWPETTAASMLNLVNKVKGNSDFDIPGVDMYFADLNLLFALKASHRYLKNSPHFLKTRRDYFALKSHLGITVNDLDTDLKAWYKIREKETYNYKHPKLDQSKNSFFNPNEGVIYTYDHDTIHVSMAQENNTPAYTLYMKDGAQVACDKNKFFAAPQKVRLNGVVEEAYVLALERSQIPFKGKVDAKKSFDMALFKVCSSITSGWFREFAYDHYDEVQKMYNPDYVNMFWKAVDNGVVRKLNPGDAAYNMGAKVA